MRTLRGATVGGRSEEEQRLFIDKALIPQLPEFVMLAYTTYVDTTPPGTSKS